MFCSIWYTCLASVPEFRLMIMRVVHIIYQEMLSSRSTNLPAFFSPRRRENNIYFFCIVAHMNVRVKSF